MTEKKKELVDLNCMVCQKDFKGEEPEYCCNGRECGCMGMPIEPIVCSEECYNNLMKNGLPKSTLTRLKID